MEMVCFGSLGILVYLTNIFKFKQTQDVLDFECKHFETQIQDYVLEFKLSEKQVDYFEQYVFDESKSESYGE